MRIWIVSDLHVNALPWVPNRIPDFDVMIVAGDLSDDIYRTRDELWKLHKLARKPVVFTPGNHDFFGSDLHAFHGVSTAWPIFVLPAGEAVVIERVRFIGATLWTDWQLGDKEWAAQAWAARSMPEFAHVTRADGDLIWPIDLSDQHDLHRERIEAVLAQPHDGPTVVVTHHAPSAKSLPKGEARGEEAAAFASDLEGMMTRYRPELWVHGHIHTARDYTVGGTRVVCNPRGYEAAGWFEKTGWVEDLVIEV